MDKIILGFVAIINGLALIVTVLWHVTGGSINTPSSILRTFSKALGVMSFIVLGIGLFVVGLALLFGGTW